jgi:hypothetical protein
MWFQGAARGASKRRQDQGGEIMRLIGAMLIAAACFGQGKQNLTQTGFLDAHAASWRFPESTFAGLPAPAAANTGWRYTVTDCLTSACTAGGGNVKADLRSDGSAWAALSGGGAGTQSSVFGGGGSTTSQRTIECASGTVSISGGTWTYPGGTAAATAAVSQEIPIITGLNGNVRYEHVLIAEASIFTSGTITGLKASLGRPGATTNDELLPQTSLMQSSGSAWFAADRPQPPVLLSSNTYSVVLAIRATGGNISALTGGAVNYEVCGYAVQ